MPSATPASALHRAMTTSCASSGQLSSSRGANASAASSLGELTALRNELVRFRVLDPACGSGNFLYVAFRELYRLDTELLSRMREFPSTKAKLSWNSGISTMNFFGIDINPFAVELAKVTLNIAKKIAFEERKEQAFTGRAG